MAQSAAVATPPPKGKASKRRSATPAACRIC